MARPGDEDVVDTGLFSLGLTPPSGTAARLQPHGDCRRRFLGSTHVSWLAGCLGPTFTTGQRQASSGRDPPRSCAASTGQTRVPAETPSSGCALRVGSTDRLRRFVRGHARSRSGNSGTLRAGSMNVPTRLTRLGCARSARPRAFLSVAGVLARHRVNWLLEIPPPTMGTPNKACCVPPQSPFSKSLRANHFEWRLSLDSI